jgi:pimeloyl-ACP methyl ester carboxylesterase
VRLQVRDFGPRDAPVLVMLHGFGSILHTWEPWARALENGYRMVHVDLPGLGLSEPDPTGLCTDERYSALLIALIDRLAISRAALTGNSIGGRSQRSI